MSEPHDKELRRLTETLRLMATEAGSPEQLEALRKGAAALCLIFVKGSWRELDDVNGALTEEMREQLRQMGLEPGRAKT